GRARRALRTRRASLACRPLRTSRAGQTCRPLRTGRTVVALRTARASVVVAVVVGVAGSARADPVDQLAVARHTRTARPGGLAVVARAEPPDTDMPVALRSPFRQLGRAVRREASGRRRGALV